MVYFRGPQAGTPVLGKSKQTISKMKKTSTNAIGKEIQGSIKSSLAQIIQQDNAI